MKTIRINEDTYANLLSLKRGNDSMDRVVRAVLWIACRAPDTTQALAFKLDHPSEPVSVARIREPEPTKGDAA